MSRRRGVTLLEIILAVLVVVALILCFLAWRKASTIEKYLTQPQGLVEWTQTWPAQQRALNGLHSEQIDFLCASWLKVRPHGDTTTCPGTGPSTDIPPNGPCYPRVNCN